MQLVILADLQSAYLASWIRVANTEGLGDVHIHDRFREQGVGPGGEELEVLAVDFSPVQGVSRIYLQRGANATAPDVHRLGAVFNQVGIAAPPPLEDSPEMSIQEFAQAINVPFPEPEAAPAGVITSPEQDSTAASELIPLKKKRGRPLGSKNVKKLEAAIPGFD